MTSRILAHIQKELLLLLRDRGGLALLYLMPVCLVSIMAVVQDAPFKDFSDKQVLVLYRDLDGGVVGKQLLEGLKVMPVLQMPFFKNVFAPGNSRWVLPCLPVFRRFW
mgnify:CR=1 FL=1